MEKFKVSQVARELGISTSAIYKKFRTGSQLVHNQTFKEKGITYLTKEGLEALRASSQKPEPETLSQDCEPVHNQFKEASNQQEVIRGLQKTIDTLIALHGEERRRTDTIIMKLTHDVGNLQKALEYRGPAFTNEPPRVVKPWEPEAPGNPLEGLGVLQKVWVKLFNPEKLRRYDS